MVSIVSYVFYKIFVNSLTVIREFGNKMAFSIEEIIGASLLLAICFTKFGSFAILGYELKNILSILLVLILGWKNGILVGATGGVTIGTVLGIITNSEPVMVASYAISGMISGIFNKLGKIGVVIGFILGNVILTYVANGNTVQIIRIQEILIAFLGLLAIPKNVKINIMDMYGENKCLPKMMNNRLEENTDTILKLNNVSDTISQIADEYKNVAATVVSDDEIISEEQENRNIFLKELSNNLDGLETNFLYDELTNKNGNIVNEIYDYLLIKEKIDKKSLLEILKQNNNYVLGIEEDANNTVNNEIDTDINIINETYKTSKLSFVWKKKLDENNENISNQLQNVSKVISGIAEEIKSKENDKFEKQKEEIIEILKQKQIELNRLDIKEEKNGKITIKVSTNICEDVENDECMCTQIKKVIEKNMKIKLDLYKQECGIRINKDHCEYVFASKDIYKLNIGIAKTKKHDSIISGDSSTYRRLDDGKFLIAISDGMGSGPEARKSSKIAIKMLERLLVSGFDKNTSLKLINSTLSANSEDMYATIDLSIFDLYSGNLEFIKNGACPTYLKKADSVQLLESQSLPAGILKDIDLDVYDIDINEGDIFVMCSDGIIESDKEYSNKELWLKYLLEDIKINDVQKIADIIIGEAQDNDVGYPKDDMTVIVAKVVKNK